MLLLQLYTIVFAAVLAWLNRIPCEKMINYGASRKEEKEWHRVNAVVKFLWAFIWPLILIITNHGLIECSLVFIVMLLIQWAVFDCVIGKLLHNNWWYLGETARLDNILVNGIRVRKAKYNSIGLQTEPEKRILGFGEQAGLMKFLIACVLILFINFYL